jgi:ATP-dependent Lon protease
MTKRNAATSHKKNLRKSKDSDSENDSHSEEEYSDSDYETVSEDDTSDSSYRPSKYSRKKKQSNSSNESESDDSSDSDESDDDVTPEKVRKIASKIFPSKYIKNKVKRDKNKNKKFKKPTKPTKNSKGKNKKRKVESSSEDEDSEDDEDYDEDEYDDEDSDDEDYDEDYDEDEDDESNKNINIIFGFGGGMDDDEDEEDYEDDENEECDSDDEKMFMKETYQNVETAIPEDSDQSKDGKKSKSDKKSKKDGKKSKKDGKKSKKDDKKDEKESDVENDSSKFESEYNDLVDMKKYLSEKLQKKPKSKMLLKSLQKCKDSIKKLIKQTRSKNTKNYHKLINGQTKKFTNEIDYFKKKLSNKEQQKIMNDLKEINSHIQIDKPYRVALLESQIPTKYKATVMQKLNMLRTMDTCDPEYYKIKNWVDTFMRIPFGKYKALNVSMEDGIEKCHDFMENAMKILDDCAYGLNDAKMQILQMVGQWIANPSAMGTAIAIKGPMGTGKTTLVKEGISKILGREFAFIALGGAGDSSFLEGHSYTYEGSSWGKIVQILIDSKCMNPVIYFDELDKISDSARGEEIIGILTHLTDTSQNSEFHDKYFSDIDFDLSKCLFIFSYNDESKVNPILRDRMYRIQTKGYDTKEKITIANNYLLPKIREQVNFTNDDVKIPDSTIEYLVTNQAFTKNEDGVRNLKRCLEIIHTKLNLFRLVKPEKNLFTKEIKMEVSFPINVTTKEVDALIKNEETQNQSLLAMYV